MKRVKRSNINIINSFWLSLGKGPARSIAIEQNSSLGTGRGFTTPSGSVVGLLLIWKDDIGE